MLRRLSPRLRKILLISGGFVAAAALALAIVVYLLLQPDRFTAMLQTQAHNAGLELKLASPASPTLFPRPALELRGITLSPQNGSASILLAARGRLVLPWRTLFGGPTVIDQLEIDSPRVDLGALQIWLAALPARSGTTAMSVPRIDAGVRIHRGSVVHGYNLLLSDLELSAGNLISGRPFPLSLSATNSTGTPLKLRLSTTPDIAGNTLQLNDISLDFMQGDALNVALKGEARWHGAANAAATLAGQLRHPAAGNYDVAMHLTPANQQEPLLLSIKLDGPDNHADLRLPPLALVQWWNTLDSADSPQLTLPPGDGQLDINALQAGPVTAEGFSMQFGRSVPASSATVIAPAAVKAAEKAKPKKP